MAKINSKPRRHAPEFDAFIDGIILDRQKIFPEERLKPKSPRRITLGLTRIPEIRSIAKKRLTFEKLP